MQITIIRSRRRTISVEVSVQAKVIVRAPYWVSQREVERFVQKNSTWVNSKIVEATQRIQTEAGRYQEGGIWWYLGNQYKLIFHDHDHITLVDEVVCVPQKEIQAVKQLIAIWYNQQAKDYILPRVAQLGRLHGIEYQGARITNAIHRWGSCGPKNSLNFAWRLIQAPPSVIDYVIVHELAHTLHKNHSKAYWRFVASLMPEYQTHRSWLSKYTHELSIS